MSVRMQPELAVLFLICAALAAGVAIGVSMHDRE